MCFLLLWSEKDLLSPDIRTVLLAVYVLHWKICGNLMFLSCHIMIKLLFMKHKPLISHPCFKHIFSGRTECRPPTPDTRTRAAGSTRSHPPS